VGEGVSGTGVTMGDGVAVGLSVGAGLAVVTHADRLVARKSTPTIALHFTALG